MSEYLKKFIEGEDILAQETNDNNDYLLNQIDDRSNLLNNKINSVSASLSSQIASSYKFFEYQPDGQFVGKDVVFVDSLNKNVPEKPEEYKDAIWLYSSPVMPYIPLNNQISGKSYDFENGGMVIATSPMTVTVGAGELSPMTFTNFVGVLPVPMGANVTTSSNAYFVGY